MFTLLRRKKVSEGITASDTAAVDAGLLQPHSAATLLATPRRKKLLEHIWQRTSLSRAQFAQLYQAPIERYAALVQLFPASEHHHHAYHGGMLDHALESVAYVLKLRQSHLLPVGAAPELQAAQAEVWTAAAAYATLLHDVGKIAVDIDVQHADGTLWHPWHGNLKHPYRFRYRPDRIYRLHGAAAGLLYTQLLGEAILDWMNDCPDVWASLLFVLAGQYEHAGMLGELVMQADRASVAQQMGGNPDAVRESPVQSLQRKLVAALRLLTREQWKLNQPEASDGWLTGDALWLVSKNACDKLRAHLLSQGIEGVPSSNPAMFNVLQEHGIVQATPEGKAIWRATVTSLTGWVQSFTFLRVAPALIWDDGNRPAAFKGTVRVDAEEAPLTTGAAAPNVAELSANAPNDEVTRQRDAVDLALDVLTETAVSAPKAVDLIASFPDALAQERSPGEQFMFWLGGAVRRRTVKINEQKALVHSVAGTAYLLSPGIFQRYVLEHPGVTRGIDLDGLADWRWIQREFERLRVHRKRANGLNIWICEVTGPRKSRRVHGYLLEDGSALFGEMPADNPHLRVIEDAAGAA